MWHIDYVVVMPDEKLVTVRAFLSPDLRNSFKSLCVKEGITMNDVIVQFIEDYVQEREKTKNPSAAKRRGQS